MAEPRGRFITLEGGEGAGKSTLTKALTAALQARGLNVVATREPGGSPGANEIRDLLVRGSEDRWSVLSEALLFAAARNDHLERVIRPALASGAWVLCDRYVDSTAAYQVAGHGLPRAIFDALHDIIGAEKPDLTLILDVDPMVGVERSRGPQSGEDRFENMDTGFHRRVREAFRDLVVKEPDRCVLIDSTQPREIVAQEAIRVMFERLAAPA